jgi:hypothetical protein
MLYSSLNWADVFGAYCSQFPRAAVVRARLAEAYARAELFVQPTPSMPMPSIRGGEVSVGPVARVGQNFRDRLIGALGANSGDHVVLMSMGGISTPIDYASWPRLGSVRVVVGSDETPDHPDIIPWRDTRLSYIDLLRSCDVLLTKPGYGHLVEAACNGVPVLYAPRDDWPETRSQIEWLERNGRAMPVTEADLRSGAWIGMVPKVLKLGAPSPPEPAGIGQTADLILERI